MKYYIVSLKHTSPNHPCLTFWCPNDAGYTHFIEHAGVYENLTKGYHDNAEHCFPVLVETAKEIMVKAIFNEKEIESFKKSGVIKYAMLALANQIIHYSRKSDFSKDDVLDFMSEVWDDSEVL